MHIMKNPKQFKYYLILFFVAFGIGFTISKLTNFGYFIIKKDISIIEALTFFVTIGLGIYIAKVLQKEIQDKRVEKDIIFRRFDEVNNMISNLSQLIQEKDINFLKIVSTISNTNKTIQNIHKVLKAIKISVSKDLEYDIQINIANLRKLLTLTPPIEDERKEKPIVINNDIVIYSEKRKIEIETEIESFKNNLLYIQLNLNKQ